VYHAPEYVALLRPAIDGWRELQREAGRPIYLETGTLFFAGPDNPILQDNVGIMAAGGVPYEWLDQAAATARFPAFAMTPGAMGAWSADGGMVDADAAVAAFVSGAEAAGAVIYADRRVTAVDADGDQARVRTDDGGTLTARHVVVAAGAWTNDLLPDLHLPIRVTRQTWFTMRPADPVAVGPDRVPVWCDYDTMYYGFPDHGPGLKIADDTPAREVVPGAVERRHDDGGEQQRLTAYLEKRFPTSDLTFEEADTCLYTLTPDGDFILGPVPGSQGRASVAVGLNHAFKFAPVIGRILADLATTGTTAHPIDRFRADRFS
jgi:sarcosine oxidase